MRTVTLRTLLLLAFAPALLAGCIDAFFEPRDPDPIVDPPPPTTAASMFKDEVFPILAARCGACHSAAPGSPSIGFVGRDPADAYERIFAFPEILGDFGPTAPLVTLGGPGHPVGYRPSEQDTILSWLAAELVERGGGVPTQPTPAAMAEAWSGCLAYPDFLAADMPAAWNTLAANGQCGACHTAANSLGGFYVSSDPLDFFKQLTTRRFTLLTFWQPDPPRNQMLPNDTRFLSAGQSPHPAFNYGSSAARQALKKLTDVTMPRFTAKVCGPSRLID